MTTKIQKYRPSNGTEGYMFMSRFCEQCTKDDGETVLCEIIARTMALDVDESEYPTEWQYGPGAQPVCTEFNARA